ncbi:MAG: hypothetical protein NZ822_03085 [Patescibacteria group bacterium]|nr:hypothetical protein [Patescibacteria group bacterium]
MLEILSEERIKYIAAISKKFAKLVGQIGVGEVRKFLERYLAQMYIRDNKGFKGIRKKLMKLRRQKNNLNRLIFNCET